jgi:gliding motility-associated-like protein
MQSFLRRLSIIALGLFFVLNNERALAQLQILTPDTIICPNTSATLNATLGTGVLTTVNFSASDDVFSAVQPLGFAFNYFGNVYINCIISLNGYIKFNTAQAGQFSPWVIPATGAIPGNTDVLNSIMAFYADIYPLFPTNPGTISAATIGVAPNRRYVVSFCDCPMFSCTTLKSSFQIILYETTNVIEVHIGNAPNCPTWNGGYAIEGIQDNSGTVAYPVPGRNVPIQWSAFHSSHRWTPAPGNTYSLTAIPYAPVPDLGAIINWYANGTNFIGTGTSVTVSPTVNTFYVAEVTKCSDTVRDTVYVTMGGGPTITNINPQPGNPAFPAPKADPTTCGGFNGFISLYGLDPNQLYNLRFRKNGVQVTPYNVTSNINGIITIAGLGAGVYDSILVYKGVCFSNLVGPITLVDPPVVANWSYVLHLGCEGDTVVITNNSIQNPINNWDFGDGTGDTSLNPIHIYPVQGIYTIKLVVSNGVCSDSLFQQIDSRHPLSASFTVDDDSACVGQTVSFTNTSVVTGGGTYFWDFGDGGTSTATNPSYVFNSAGSYNVMMVVTDVVPCSDTAYITIKVDPTPFVDFTTSDSLLCEGRGITFLGSYATDGNTGIYWNFGDGNIMPNRDQVLHAYDSAGIITVTLTATYRNCPDATITKSLNILPFPTLDIGKDTAMCPNAEPIVIGDFKNQFATATWSWNTGETTPLIAVRHPGIYTARVSMNGCSTQDSIEVFKDCYLNIPNSFSPNGDGLNDYFLPRQLLSEGLMKFKMTVFNRWGQVIFETAKIDGRGWDGKFNDKEQPGGVYVYLIEATIKNGIHEQYQGNVTLLR